MNTRERPGRRDCSCPRAQHTHGTRAAYTADKCRCLPCCIANSRLHATGQWTEHLTADPCGARRRLQALVTVGWSLGAIATRTGRTKQSLQQIIDGSRTKLYLHTAAAVRDIYNELWDQKPPQTTRWEKAAITRARALADRNGWVGPFAWDDETIDDPTAAPWTPPADASADDLDEVLVERVMTGRAPLNSWQRISPEHVEAVRRLLEQGLSDRLVGERVGRSKDSVAKIRTRILSNRNEAAA